MSQEACLISFQTNIKEIYEFNPNFFGYTLKQILEISGMEMKFLITYIVHCMESWTFYWQLLATKSETHPLDLPVQSPL